MRASGYHGAVPEVTAFGMRIDTSGNLPPSIINRRVETRARMAAPRDFQSATSTEVG